MEPEVQHTLLGLALICNLYRASCGRAVNVQTNLIQYVCVLSDCLLFLSSQRSEEGKVRLES